MTFFTILTKICLENFQIAENCRVKVNLNCYLKAKSIKHVCCGKWSDRATSYCSKLKVLKLPDQMQIEIPTFVFEFYSKNFHLPSQLFLRSLITSMLKI